MSVVQTVYQWTQQNPIAFAGIMATITNVAQFVFSAFVSSLPAPTATSSAKYQFWFKFFNTIAGNLSRAKMTAVESSPNFQDAVNKANAQAPQEKPVVVVQPPAAT